MGGHSANISNKILWEQMRLCFESLPDPILLLDTSFVVLESNSAFNSWVDTMGIQPDKIVGRGFRDFFELSEDTPIRLEALHHGQYIDIKGEIRGVKGEVVWRLLPIRSALSGNVEFIAAKLIETSAEHESIATLLDETASYFQKINSFSEMEDVEELAFSMLREAVLNLKGDYGVLIVFLPDAKTPMVLVSGARGGRRKEIEDQILRSIEINDQWLSKHLSDSPVVMERRVSAKNGLGKGLMWRYFNNSKFAIGCGLSVNGPTVGFLGIMYKRERTLSHYKRLWFLVWAKSTSLLINNALYRRHLKLLRHMKDLSFDVVQFPVLEVSLEDFRVRSINSYGEKVFGRELVGQKLSEIVDANTWHRLEQTLLDMRSGRRIISEFFPGVFVFHSGGHRFHIFCRYAPYLYEEGTAYVLLFEDVSPGQFVRPFVGEPTMMVKWYLYKIFLNALSMLVINQLMVVEYVRNLLRDLIEHSPNPRELQNAALELENAYEQLNTLVGIVRNLLEEKIESEGVINVSNYLLRLVQYQSVLFAGAVEINNTIKQALVKIKYNMFFYLLVYLVDMFIEATRNTGRVVIDTKMSKYKNKDYYTLILRFSVNNDNVLDRIEAMAKAGLRSKKRTTAEQDELAIFADFVRLIREAKGKVSIERGFDTVSIISRLPVVEDQRRYSVIATRDIQDTGITGDLYPIAFDKALIIMPDSAMANQVEKFLRHRGLKSIIINQISEDLRELALQLRHNPDIVIIDDDVGESFLKKILRYLQEAAPGIMVLTIGPKEPLRHRRLPNLNAHIPKPYQLSDLFEIMNRLYKKRANYTHPSSGGGDYSPVN